MLYVGERLHCFESIDKEVLIKNIESYRTIASCTCVTSGVRSMVTVYTFHDPAKRCDRPLKETSETTPPVLDQRKGDISQPTLYMKADAESEPENDCGIVQRHATAKPLYLPDLQPEVSPWTVSDHDEIDPSISTSAPVFLPELQPDTACSWCGCLQFSYKPSQGVVSCDGCFTSYHPNDLTAVFCGLGEYGSTEISFDPLSGLNDFQGDLVNYEPRPEITTPSTRGNDLDDFSWFMVS